MFIPKEIIDQVRERADIVDVIKSYIPTLKKSGNNYTGLCPFHKEKTPSFVVSPEKKIFHCFGCHIGGNVFTFITKIERIGFIESVKLLADRVGIEIDEKNNDNNKRNEKFDEIIRLHDYTARLYHHYLISKNGIKGQEYLTGRGVDQNSINTFNIGLAPDNWEFLYNSLSKKKANIKLALEAGLLNRSKKKENHYYDRFRDRIIFPIYNEKNKVIAFGGRILNQETPKYLNSPESELFQKRRILYGLNIAKPFILELKRVIIVEGYLDVIGCYQAGINNVVAPLGTALTTDHIKLLSRFCNEIILLFDADSAGINATLRTLAIAENISIDIKVAVLPEGDPFEFITQKGMRTLMSIVDTALKPVDFKIEQVMADNSSKNRIEKLIRLFDIIKTLEYQTERDNYLKQISRKLNESEITILKDFDKYLKKSRVGNKTEQNYPLTNDNNNKSNFKDTVYKDLIELLIHNPDIIEKAVIDFDNDSIENNIYGSILLKIFDIYSREHTFSIDKMFDFFQDGLEMEILNNLLQIDYQRNNPMSVYTDIFVRLKEYEINQKIKHFTQLLSQNNSRDNSYLAEIEVLKREQEKLSSYLTNKQH